MSYSVLVVGAGVSGMSAALELANSGLPVVLVERRPIIGGSMAAELNYGTTGNGAFSDVRLPTSKAVDEHPNIEVLTSSEILEVAGKAKEFTVTIRQQARFVTDACTLCNSCREVCPVAHPNEFQAGMTYRKAIHIPLPQSVPNTYVIDIERCLNDPPNYLACQRCTEVCEDNAINFDMPPVATLTREVGAIVLSTGFEQTSPGPLRKFGYGRHPDVLLAVELDSLLTPTGPTGGFAQKPTDESYPETVLFVLADESDLSWGVAAGQVKELLEQEIGDITVLYSHARASGDWLEDRWEGLMRKGVKLLKGKVANVRIEDDDSLYVRYIRANDRHTITQEFDMIVVSNPYRPSDGAKDLAARMGVELGINGYVQTVDSEASGIESTRKGVFVIGAAAGPKLLRNCVSEAQVVTEWAGFLVDRRKAPRSVAVQPSVGVGHSVSEAEMRARIEKAIWALLNKE